MVGIAKDKDKDKGKLKPEFQAVHEWIKAVELSRKRKNFARDFSDGCLVAEVIKHYAGSKFAVDMHNYSEALSGPRKRDNWNLLNDKVLRKHLGIKLDKVQIEELCSAADGAAEKLLLVIKAKFDAGAPPPVRKQLLPPPEEEQGAKHADKHDSEVVAHRPARRHAPDEAGLVRGGRTGGISQEKKGRGSEPVRSPQFLPHMPSNSPHANRHGEYQAPHPPAERSGWGVPASGERGRQYPRASSASKVAQRVSPKRKVVPGPQGKGKESREWWGDSSQERDRYGAHAQRDDGMQEDGEYGRRDGGFGGALDNLLALAQGDLNQFDMKYQMHLKHMPPPDNDVVLPPVKFAQRREKAKVQVNDLSLSPGKRPSNSKQQPVPQKQIPKPAGRPSPQKVRGAAGGNRDVSPSKRGRGGLQGGDAAKEGGVNKMRREGRRQAWAELEREGGVPAEDGPDLVEECDEALDGLRAAQTELERAIVQFEKLSRQAAVARGHALHVPGVGELGGMASAANERMAKKAQRQGVEAAGVAGGGRGGDGGWGANYVDLLQEQGALYRSAEEDLPGGNMARMRELELMGLNRDAGVGPAGSMGVAVGAGWGEFRKMQGEMQSYPWFNPYLPRVAPPTPGPNSRMSGECI
jgi:hypothetical protein